MKNKITLSILTLGSLVAFGSLAMANEEKNEAHGERFAEFKTAIISRLNEEKAVLDQATKCISAAQNKEELKKCHDAKKTSMDKIHAAAKEKRREHIAEKLNKMENKSKEADSAAKK